MYQLPYHNNRYCISARLPAHDCVGGVLHDGGGLEVVARRVELKLEELAGVERQGYQGHRGHVAPRRGALPGKQPRIRLMIDIELSTCSKVVKFSSLNIIKIENSRNCANFPPEKKRC